MVDDPKQPRMVRLACRNLMSNEDQRETFMRDQHEGSKPACADTAATADKTFNQPGIE
jgi:hypothetical protein